jgi:hypothetical protein
MSVTWAKMSTPLPLPRASVARSSSAMKAPHARCAKSSLTRAAAAAQSKLSEAEPRNGNRRVNDKSAPRWARS